jgi:hypothetical protein
MNLPTPTLYRIALSAFAVPVALAIALPPVTGAFDAGEAVADALGLRGAGFWILATLAIACFLVDEAIAAADARYADQLYALLKDIAETVRNGSSIEAAVQHHTLKARGSAAADLREALDLARDVPFDQALRQMADDSGQPAMLEVGHAVATAVTGGGHIGPSLRWLAGHLARMRASEVEFTGTLQSPLRVLRGIALLAGPFLYTLMFFAVRPEERGLDTPTVAFFFWGVLVMSALDGLVYGRWSRVVPKLPAYLALVRLSLGLF